MKYYFTSSDFATNQDLMYRHARYNLNLHLKPRLSDGRPRWQTPRIRTHRASALIVAVRGNPSVIATRSYRVTALHLSKGASGSGNIKSEAKSACFARTEEFFLKIYQQVATGIAITDWRGVFQECNPAYYALIGYTEKELRTIDLVTRNFPSSPSAKISDSRRA